MTDQTQITRALTAGHKQIEPMLVASTIHIRVDEAARLDLDQFSALAPKMTRDTGWLFYVAKDSGVQDRLSYFSDGFEALILRAQALGCPWLMLDCDAAPIDDIPTYEW